MAKKLESNLANMFLSLVLISVTMSAALALVYEKTKGPIAETARLKEVASIREVLPEFDSDPTTGAREVNGLVVYPVYRQGAPVGYAIKTNSEKGFGGNIELMAGFLPDGTINRVTVLDHSETPGLGTKMEEPAFIDQFNGRNPANYSLKVRKDGGQVDAITAATVTSRAFCDALQRAWDAYNQLGDSLAVVGNE